MRISLAALAPFGFVLFAACTPMPADSPDGASPRGRPPSEQAGASIDPAACAVRGGEVRRVGRLQREACIILYADAGKACTDGDQCQGDCRSEDLAPKPGPVTGVCQADSGVFGCHASVENGQITNAVCVD